MTDPVSCTPAASREAFSAACPVAVSGFVIFSGSALRERGEPVAHFRGACQDFSEIPVDEAGQSLAADTGSRGLVPLHFNGVGSGPGERPVVGARHEPALPSGVIPERGERLLRRLVPGDGGP